MAVRDYIACEWAEASLGEVGVLEALGGVRSRDRDSATAGKIRTDSRPAQTKAAPVTEEMVPTCMPIVAAVTRNGSEVASNRPAATVRPAEIAQIQRRRQTADQEQPSKNTGTRSSAEGWATSGGKYGPAGCAAARGQGSGAKPLVGPTAERAAST